MQTRLGECLNAVFDFTQQSVHVIAVYQLWERAKFVGLGCWSPKMKRVNIAVEYNSIHSISEERNIKY
jgi:hypothetical protein